MRCVVWSVAGLTVTALLQPQSDGGVGVGGAAGGHAAQRRRRADRGAAGDRVHRRSAAATRQYTHGFGRAEDLAGLVVVLHCFVRGGLAGRPQAAILSQDAGVLDG